MSMFPYRTIGPPNLIGERDQGKTKEAKVESKKQNQEQNLNSERRTLNPINVP